MEKSKAETFIGFAIRSGKCKIGSGSVETLRKAELIVVCKTASENTIKQAKKFARRLKTRLFVTVDKTLSLMTYKENSKMIAITDSALAAAIVKFGGKEFIEVGVEING